MNTENIVTYLRTYNDVCWCQQVSERKRTPFLYVCLHYVLNVIYLQINENNLFLVTRDAIKSLYSFNIAYPL
jgi:hypothetical protein